MEPSHRTGQMAMRFPGSKVLSFIILVLVADAQNDTFGTNVPACDTAPDALTTVARQYFLPGSDIEIPQTCIEFGGHERCYYTYIPYHCASAEGGSPTEIPLIVANHGMGICPSLLTLFDGWVPRAMQECMVVVYPMGTIDPTVADTSCFNVPGGIAYEATDNTTSSTRDCCCESSGVPVLPDPEDMDSEFVRLVIQETWTSLKEADIPLQVDATRIYLSGLSNGCITALSTAALHSDLIAGVACHAGAVVTPVADDYSPVPTWLVHGTKDGSILYNGTVYGPGLGFMPVSSGLEYLISQNGCVSSVTENFGNGTGTITYGTEDCAAPVELLTLYDVGHLPYLGLEPLASDPADAIIATVDTSALAWEFLKAHQKEATPLVFRETDSPSATPTESPVDTPTASPVIADGLMSGSNKMTCFTSRLITTIFVLALGPLHPTA